jgi:hypothetical protein
MMLLALVLLWSFSSECESAVTRRVFRPWTRTSGASSAPPAGSSLSVNVEGTSEPLLGSEDPTRTRIAEAFTDLLVRRGYRTTDSGADYRVRIDYRTERVEHENVALSTSAESFDFAASQFGIGSNYGMHLAQIIAHGSVISTSVGIRGEIRFLHTVSVEVTRPDGNSTWKGEATWESDRLDIVSELAPTMLLVIRDSRSPGSTP